jgi:SOS-response transcriptional repressor LexA
MELIVKQILKLDTSTQLEFQLLSKIKNVFSNPADHYKKTNLDLNGFLIQNSRSTYQFLIESKSIVNANIHSGGLPAVDKSKQFKNDDFVTAVSNRYFTAKKLKNENSPPNEINEDAELIVRRVVTGLINLFRKRK